MTRRIARDDSGAALVEFGMLLPVMLLFFALMIEGSRTLWSYQAAIAGVRDASRWLGRTASADICTEGGSLAGLEPRLTAIVRNTVDGNAIFPAAIRIDRVTPALACHSGDFRRATVAVGTVTATLTITYPFDGVFGLFGLDLDTVTTTVTDSARVFGT